MINVVEEKGFFFLRGEDGLDYFAHRSELPDKQIALVREGQVYLFTPQLVENKGWQAWAMERVASNDALDIAVNGNIDRDTL